MPYPAPYAQSAGPLGPATPVAAYRRLQRQRAAAQRRAAVARSTTTVATPVVPVNRVSSAAPSRYVPRYDQTSTAFAARPRDYLLSDSYTARVAPPRDYFTGQAPLIARPRDYLGAPTALPVQSSIPITGQADGWRQAAIAAALAAPLQGADVPGYVAPGVYNGVRSVGYIGHPAMIANLTDAQVASPEVRKLVDELIYESKGTPQSIPVTGPGEISNQSFYRADGTYDWSARSQALARGLRIV